MERLSDTELIETYRKAKELKCSPDFILLLLTEMKKRDIEINHKTEVLFNM